MNGESLESGTLLITYDFRFLDWMAIQFHKRFTAFSAPSEHAYFRTATGDIQIEVRKALSWTWAKSRTTHNVGVTRTARDGGLQRRWTIYVSLTSASLLNHLFLGAQYFLVAKESSLFYHQDECLQSNEHRFTFTLSRGSPNCLHVLLPNQATFLFEQVCIIGHYLSGG